MWIVNQTYLRPQIVWGYSKKFSRQSEETKTQRSVLHSASLWKQWHSWASKLKIKLQRLLSEVQDSPHLVISSSTTFCKFNKSCNHNKLGLLHLLWTLSSRRRGQASIRLAQAWFWEQLRLWLVDQAWARICPCVSVSSQTNPWGSGPESYRAVTSWVSSWRLL